MSSSVSTLQRCPASPQKLRDQSSPARLHSKTSGALRLPRQDIASPAFQRLDAAPIVIIRPLCEPQIVVQDCVRIYHIHDSGESLKSQKCCPTFASIDARRRTPHRLFPTNSARGRPRLSTIILRLRRTSRLAQTSDPDRPIPPSFRQCYRRLLE